MLNITAQCDDLAREKVCGIVRAQRKGISELESVKLSQASDTWLRLQAAERVWNGVENP